MENLQTYKEKLTRFTAVKGYGLNVYQNNQAVYSSFKSGRKWNPNNLYEAIYPDSDLLKKNDGKWH